MKCECKCGRSVKTGNKFVRGHNTAHPAIKFDEVPTARDRATGCLRWQGSIYMRSGYGYFGKTYAHRAAYEKEHGSIPLGMTIDHVYARGCRFKDCVEPTHLEAVTSAENTRRAQELRPLRTHCKNGHSLNGVNLRVTRRATRTERLCVTCDRARKLAWYRANATQARSKSQ